MSARFVVDENSLDLDGVSASLARAMILAFLDLVEELQADHGVCFDDELMSRPLLGNKTFWELFNEDAGLDLSRDDLERASIAFGPMQRWYELDDTELSITEVSVDGNTAETSGSIAWAHAQASRKGGVVACICAPHTRRTGVCKVVLKESARNVWFVSNPVEVEGFFRWVIAQYADRADQIEALAPAAFRKLRFVDGCFGGIGQMSKPCRQLAPVIVHHLSAFSDHGERIFSPEDRSQVTAEFGALGVEITDENGKTKRNSRAAQQRIRFFEGENYYFWWHSKLERNVDRIHICPIIRGEGILLVVGIFCRHLD